MSTHRRLTIILLASVFGAAFVASPAAAQPVQLPTDFANETVLGPTVDRPVGLTFLPDGRLLFIEAKTAKIRMIVNDVVASTDPLCVVDSVLTSLAPIDEEKGLLGIEVDAQWPARPYVYVVHDAPGDVVWLSRLTVTGDLSDPASGNLSIDPASRHHLLRDIPDIRPNHNGGALMFGPDGMLYVALAEDADACAAQDTVSLRGVMLRLDVSGLPPGSGIASKAAMVPVDNPFALHPNLNMRLLWSRGLRNPFRMDIDPATGNIFLGDVGHDQREEIDVVDGVNINFGWPYYEGTFAKFLVGCPVPLQPNLRSPIHEYSRQGLLGTICVIGGVVYRPTTCVPACSWPPEYDGDYFFADYYQGFLRRLKNTGGVWSLAPAVPGQPNATDWARGFAQTTQFARGPDGAMWYARFSVNHEAESGSIERIRFTGSTVGVERPAAADIVFAAPIPSPARGETRFSYTLPRAAQVEMTLYDALGRRVRVVESARGQSAGRHTARWDGRDEAGREVQSGVYVVRLAVDGRSLERRFPLVR